MSDCQRHVHFVGTIGLPTVKDVFSKIGRELGECLVRLPDGEIGGRRQWISYQIPVLRSYGFLKPVPPNQFFPLDLVDDFDPAEAQFMELGYAREARVSYEDFTAAKAAADIPQGVKFQVCMPTPIAVVGRFLTQRAVHATEEAYTKAILQEVEQICAHIPHDELAFQWDVCREMNDWDQNRDADGMMGGDDPRMEIIRRMKRVSEAVPIDVELGYHLCFGNFNGGDVEQPRDTAEMINLYHALGEAVDRPINWVHLPAPANADEAFFAGLKDLNLRPETELFLGVIHDDDEPEVLQQRIALAEKYAPGFGVATRCGIARDRSVSGVERLISLHKLAACVSV